MSDLAGSVGGGSVSRERGRSKQRQCLICRSRLEKSEMLRLVVDDEGQIWPDIFQKAPGRGTYLCMQEICLEQLSDKRLGALRRNFSVALPQHSKLLERMQSGLYQQLMRLFSQHRAVAVLGRDAVMHQMWKSGPLLLLLAADAGSALVRQINDAVEKRQESGKSTVLLHSFSAQFLAEAFARDKISVAALDRKSVSVKLHLFCTWYEQVGRLKQD